MVHSITADLERQLELRLGRTYVRQRLGIERDHEQRVFGDGTKFVHVENWRYSPFIIRATLKLLGLYGRGRRNAERLEVRQNVVRSAHIPREFDGFTILHISDMHVDMNEGAIRCLTTILPELNYDICVLTGDYRGKTHGPFDQTLAGLAQVRDHLKDPIYGVLGNHDTIAMVPCLERLGIRMLLNETEVLSRGSDHIYLAGIDDPNYYCVHNIEQVAAEVPDREFFILLSHTPEIYRQAAHADFDLLLSGHTHGGQICLPGSVSITLARRRPSTPLGIRCVEISRYGRIHVGWAWFLRCSRAVQLPAGSNASSAATRLAGRDPLERLISNTKTMKKG
jgi:predicted MPP superfamily phosphohydrolase